MADLFESGMGYSSINTARSALSTMVKFTDVNMFGQHDLVKRLLKGVFNERPSLPRYSSTWDVKEVLNYLDSLNTKNLGLKLLTLKVTMLLALVTSQRLQTLKALKLSNLVIEKDKYLFIITDLLKQSRPGFHTGTIDICQYVVNKNLCPCATLDSYIELTKNVRLNEDQLLISFQKPFKSVSTESIGRWLKAVLFDSGIDISRYKAHSTRAASASSAAKVTSFPVSEILKAGGWSNTGTFGVYYNKPVEVVKSFGLAVLDRHL